MSAAPFADRWLAMLRACESASARIERALSQEHSLCVSAFELMDEMSRQQGFIRVVALTDKVSRSQSQVSRLIAQMVEAGYVVRERDPEDARGFQVKLSAIGKRALQRAVATVENELKRLVCEDNPTLAPWLGASVPAHLSA